MGISTKWTTWAVGNHRRLSLCAIGLTAPLSVFVSASVQAQGLSSIRLSAERTTLRADGKSNTVLIAEVQDDQGKLVADGTRIVFAITSGDGRLDSTTVTTRNGVARVRLTAGELEGTAIVTVNLDAPQRAAPAQITLIYTNDASALETESPFIHVEGKEYVGFAADKQIIQANGKNGGALLSYRGVKIVADTIQYDTGSNMILALGNVTLSRGKQKREYTNLRYNLVGGDGIAERSRDGLPHGYIISGIAFDEKDAPLVDSAAWTPKDLSDSSALVKAKLIDLQPGVRVQFKRATLYLDGSRTVSLPYHVINLNGTPNFTEQIIGYGAQGITVDVPYYYDVTASTIGTAHLRQGAPVGAAAYSNRSGWSLDFDQSYQQGYKANGRFDLIGVTRSNWGARYQHQQRLDNATSGNLYVDLPNQRNLYASSQISHRFPEFNMNFGLSGSYQKLLDVVTGKNSGGGDFRGQIDADTNAHPIPGFPIGRYQFNTSISRQSFYGTGARGLLSTEFVGLQTYTLPLLLRHALTLTQSASVGQTWLSGGGTIGNSSGITFQTGTYLRQQLGRVGYGQFNYTFLQSPSSGVASSAIPHHRIGLDTDLTAPNGWNLSFNGSKTLDADQFGFSSSLRINPDFRKGNWRATVRYYTSRVSKFNFTEVEYALIPRILGKEIAILYSTTAHRFQIELNGARF